MNSTQQVRGARDVCHGKQRVSPFYRTTHASSAWLLHFGHHSFWTFGQVVHQPDDVHTSTFPQMCNHSWSCRASILEGAFFHRMNWCKFLWGNPCTAIEPFYHWDFSSGLRILDAFLSFCCMNELGEGFGCVDFARILISCRKLQLSPSGTLPVGFPLPTVSKNSLSSLFCHLILDQGVFYNFHFRHQNSYRTSCSIHLFTIVLNLW